MSQITPPLPNPSNTNNTAIKAGWICFALGWCTFWIFGLGMVFFSVCLVLGIVAMATKQVRQGLILFCCALGSLVIIPVGTMLLGIGIVGSAVVEAQSRMAPERTAIAQPLPNPAKETTHTFHAAPPPSSARSTVNHQNMMEDIVRKQKMREVEQFIQRAKVSSILSGNPAIAVINGNDFQVGDILKTPGGESLYIRVINERSVALEWQGKNYAVEMQ